MQVDPDRELAQPFGAQVRGKVELRPDRLFDIGGLPALDVAGDFNQQLRLALGDRDPALAIAGDQRQVGVRQTVAQQQLRVE